jgi:hypothetical protein
MSDSTKQIEDWKNKVRSAFGESSRLYDYLFETMDNFYYRYLETVESQNLKTSQLGECVWGAVSFESSMVEALKVKQPVAHTGILELAKRVPKAQKPLVRYGLWVEVRELDPERGHLILTSEIAWDFPDFKDQGKTFRKNIDFKYQDFQVYRKELALKLEEACSLFS